MDRHLAAVAAYVRRRVASWADAEELVADVFVRAWRHTETRPDGVEAERAWLLAIARHRVIDHYRRDDARTRMRQRLAARSAPLVEDGPEPRDDPALAHALARLSHEDRELLRLVAWEQLPHADIATVLGCTTANVAVRVHRARARLREHLDDLDHAPCLSAGTERSS